MELGDIAGGVLASKGYKVKTIDGDVYAIKLMPATQGLSLALNLIKIFLPSLGAWADGEKKEQFILPEDNQMFSEVAMLLVSQMDKVDLSAVVRSLLNGVLYNNEQVDFDKHFSAKYDELIELVEFAMRENFGSFFTNYLRRKGIDLGSILPSQEASEEPQAEMEATQGHTPSE